MIMPRRRFGRSGLEIPALTFGGGWVGGHLIRADEADREFTLDRAYDAGIDWIDTAALYGNGVSETVIGQWLKKRPEARRPRVSTKFNADLSAPDLEAQITGSVKESLNRLGLPKVPLLILHNQILPDQHPAPDSRSLRPKDILAKGGVVDIMDKLRSQGLCDWIGLTALGDPSAITQVVDSGRFDAAQVYYNLLNPSAAKGRGARWNTNDFDGLLDRCAAQDMGVMGIRIFAAGHLAASERHGREIPITDNAEDAAEEARAAAVFEALGDTYGNRAQTALRFGLASAGLSTIVIGIGEHAHLEVALQAVEMGPLPADAMATLQSLWGSHPAFVT